MPACETDTLSPPETHTSFSSASGFPGPGVACSFEAFHWSIPSRPELVEPIVMALKARAESCGICSADRSTGLVISLTEAITNAIVHGNLEITSELREKTDGSYSRLLAERCGNSRLSSREVHVDVRWNGAMCTWTVTDSGAGFNVDSVIERLDAQGDTPSELASGRGILLMRAFMDDISWAKGGREVCLAMTHDHDRSYAIQHRKQVRHAVRAKGFEERPRENVDAVVTGISLDGANLVGVGLSNARRLLIELEHEGKAIMLPAEVRQITSLGNDWMQIDCRFAEANDPARVADENAQEALDSLLQSASKQVEDCDERRNSNRYQYTEVVRVHRKDGSILHGVSRDLSKGGMAFIGNFALERGEVLTLTLEPEANSPVRITCEVVRCQQLAGPYRDLGVRFFPEI